MDINGRFPTDFKGPGKPDRPLHSQIAYPNFAGPNLIAMQPILFSLLSLVLFFSACNTGGASSTPEGSTGPSGLQWAAYETEAIPGTDTKTVILRDPSNGLIRERGQMRNGLAVGAWQFYEGDQDAIPAKLITFVDGRYNGVYLEYDDQGGLDLIAHYRNNKLHGPWGNYRFGRPEKTANYVDGELDGLYQEFSIRNGNLLKEANYKNGKEDGMFRFYNDAGELTMEYEYRDGEKVSGGMVQ